MPTDKLTQPKIVQEVLGRAITNAWENAATVLQKALNVDESFTQLLKDAETNQELTLANADAVAEKILLHLQNDPTKYADLLKELKYAKLIDTMDKVKFDIPENIKDIATPSPLTAEQTCVPISTDIEDSIKDDPNAPGAPLALFNSFADFSTLEQLIANEAPGMPENTEAVLENRHGAEAIAQGGKPLPFDNIKLMKAFDSLSATEALPLIQDINNLEYLSDKSSKTYYYFEGDSAVLKSISIDATAKQETTRELLADNIIGKDCRWLNNLRSGISYKFFLGILKGMENDLKSLCDPWNTGPNSSQIPRVANSLWCWYKTLQKCSEGAGLVLTSFTAKGALALQLLNRSASERNQVFYYDKTGGQLVSAVVHSCQDKIKESEEHDLGLKDFYAKGFLRSVVGFLKGSDNYIKDGLGEGLIKNNEINREQKKRIEDVVFSGFRMSEDISLLDLSKGDELFTVANNLKDCFKQRNQNLINFYNQYDMLYHHKFDEDKAKNNELHKNECRECVETEGIRQKLKYARDENNEYLRDFFLARLLKDAVAANEKTSAAIVTLKDLMKQKESGNVSTEMKKIIKIIGGIIKILDASVEPTDPIAQPKEELVMKFNEQIQLLLSLRTQYDGKTLYTYDLGKDAIDTDSNYAFKDVSGKISMAVTAKQTALVEAILQDGQFEAAKSFMELQNRLNATMAMTTENENMDPLWKKKMESLLNMSTPCQFMSRQFDQLYPQSSDSAQEESSPETKHMAEEFFAWEISILETIVALLAEGKKSIEMYGTTEATEVPNLPAATVITFMIKQIPSVETRRLQFLNPESNTLGVTKASSEKWEQCKESLKQLSSFLEDIEHQKKQLATYSDFKSQFAPIEDSYEHIIAHDLKKLAGQQLSEVNNQQKDLRKKCVNLFNEIKKKEGEVSDNKLAIKWINGIKSTVEWYLDPIQSGIRTTNTMLYDKLDIGEQSPTLLPSQTIKIPSICEAFSKQEETLIDRMIDDRKDKGNHILYEEKESSVGIQKAEKVMKNIRKAAYQDRSFEEYFGDTAEPKYDSEAGLKKIINEAISIVVSKSAGATDKESLETQIAPFVDRKCKFIKEVEKPTMEELIDEFIEISKDKDVNLKELLTGDELADEVAVDKTVIKKAMLRSFTKKEKNNVLERTYEGYVTKITNSRFFYPPADFIKSRNKEKEEEKRSAQVAIQTKAEAAQATFRNLFNAYSLQQHDTTTGMVRPPDSKLASWFFINKEAIERLITEDKYLINPKDDTILDKDNKKFLLDKLADLVKELGTYLKEYNQLEDIYKPSDVPINLTPNSIAEMVWSNVPEDKKNEFLKTLEIEDELHRKWFNANAIESILRFFKQDRLIDSTDFGYLLKCCFTEDEINNKSDPHNAQKIRLWKNKIHCYMVAHYADNDASLGVREKQEINEKIDAYLDAFFSLDSTILLNGKKRLNYEFLKGSLANAPVGKIINMLKDIKEKISYHTPKNVETGDLTWQSYASDAARRLSEEEAKYTELAESLANTSIKQEKRKTYFANAGDAFSLTCVMEELRDEIFPLWDLYHEEIDEKFESRTKFNVPDPDKTVVMDRRAKIALELNIEEKFASKKDSINNKMKEVKWFQSKKLDTIKEIFSYKLLQPTIQMKELAEALNNFGEHVEGYKTLLDVYTRHEKSRLSLGSTPMPDTQQATDRYTSFIRDRDEFLQRVEENIAKIKRSALHGKEFTQFEEWATAVETLTTGTYANLLVPTKAT